MPRKAAPKGANTDAIAALRKELGVAPPEGVAALGVAELGILTAAIKAAKLHHSEALETALVEAFNHVPALLRGSVKRVVLR